MNPMNLKPLDNHNSHLIIQSFYSSSVSTIMECTNLANRILDEIEFVEIWNGGVRWFLRVVVRLLSIFMTSWFRALFPFRLALLRWANGQFCGDKEKYL